MTGYPGGNGRPPGLDLHRLPRHFLSPVGTEGYSVTEEGPKMLSVDSIHEEYEYIAKQRCECGGTYQVNKQTLLKSVPNGKHFDSLRARCVKCGAVRSFAFDVSELFRQYERCDVSELFRRYERMLAKRKQNDAAEEEADKKD